MEKNDKDKLKALFTEWQICFSEEANSISLKTGKPKVDGYSGFYAKFSFTDDGEFLNVGIFE